MYNFGHCITSLQHWGWWATSVCHCSCMPYNLDIDICPISHAACLEHFFFSFKAYFVGFFWFVACCGPYVVDFLSCCMLWATFCGLGAGEESIYTVDAFWCCYLGFEECLLIRVTNEEVKKNWNKTHFLTLIILL